MDGTKLTWRDSEHFSAELEKTAIDLHLSCHVLEPQRASTRLRSGVPSSTALVETASSNPTEESRRISDDTTELLQSLISEIWNACSEETKESFREFSDAIPNSFVCEQGSAVISHRRPTISLERLRENLKEEFARAKSKVSLIDKEYDRLAKEVELHELQMLQPPLNRNAVTLIKGYLDLRVRLNLHETEQRVRLEQLRTAFLEHVHSLFLRHKNNYKSHKLQFRTKLATCKNHYDSYVKYLSRDNGAAELNDFPALWNRFYPRKLPKALSTELDFAGVSTMEDLRSRLPQIRNELRKLEEFARSRPDKQQQQGKALPLVLHKSAAVQDVFLLRDFLKCYEDMEKKLSQEESSSQSLELRILRDKQYLQEINLCLSTFEASLLKQFQALLKNIADSCKTLQTYEPVLDSSGEPLPKKSKSIATMNPTTKDFASELTANIEYYKQEFRIHCPRIILLVNKHEDSQQALYDCSNKKFDYTRQASILCEACTLAELFLN